ncbi:hypothetical protein MY1884_007858 [Beauveria asiatica]
MRNHPPGVQTAMPQLLGWAINGYAPLMLLLGVFAAARSYMHQTLALFEKHFTTELHVRPSDPPYDMLMAYVYSEGLNKTTFFEHRGDYWKRTAVNIPRSLSSVIITKDLKHKLVQDLNQYLDADNQAKYSEHRIPYRRGYLLYGPPGTGKSSLGSAIAGHCGLDIYIVDIPCVNDEQLKELFHKLPRKCIVLLEDIDAVGADRDEDGDEHKGRRHQLSLSGLLNALDGVAAQQGRLLIMTTNHKENLDPALIRPGRIDLNLELTYANSELTANLFEFMYKPVGDTVSLKNEVLVAEAVEMDLDVFRKLCLQQRSKEGAADPPEQGPSPPKETRKPPAASPKPPAQPETPSFQLPDSEGCSKPGADEEPCLGSIAWCDKHGQGDKNACLLTRGLDVKAFEETFQGLIAPVKQGILTWAQNVTKNAALREILFNSTKEAAQKSIATGLSGYMDKVQGSLGKQALEGLRKGLEKYAGQKLF